MLIYYVATVVESDFKPASGRSITVKYKDSGDTATIFSSKSGGASGNPLTTDSNGQIKFWATYAEYTLATGTEELDVTIEEALGQTEIVTLPISAATITINAYEGNAFKTTLTEDVTLAFTNIINSDNSVDELTRYELFVAQDVTGGWEITFPGSVTFLEGTAQQPRPGSEVVTKYTLDTYDNGITWYASIGGGASTAGDVFGSASSTDNAIVRANGTDGKNIQSSGWTIDDSDKMSAGGTLDLGVQGIDDNYLSAPIPLSQVGTTNLDATFTSVSIIAALNENKTAINSLTATTFNTYATVAAAELATGSDNARCYVVETESYYRYEADGSAYTDDNTFVLSTGDGGNTRWLAVAGQYVYNDLHVFNKFYDTYVTAGIGLGESGQTALATSFINNSIVGALNELKYSNIVKVSSLSDFPTPVSGVITLDQDAAYILNADVNIGINTIKANTTANSVNLIKSSNTSGFTLTYTGTGAMFTDSTLTTSFFINEIQYSTPNGKVCDIQDTTASGTGTFLLFTTQGILCNEMGSVQDVRYISFFSQEILCGQGWQFNDCNSITYNFINRLLSLNISGTTYIEVDGENGPITIIGNFFEPLSNESAIDIKSTSSTTGGTISISQFDTSGGGSIFASGSKDEADEEWTYTGNPRGPSSTAIIPINVGENTLTTTITNQNTYYLPNCNTWFDCPLCKTQRFVLDTDGVAEYTGLEVIPVSISGNVVVQNVTGVEQDLGTRYSIIYKENQFAVTFTNATNTVNETGTTRINGEKISFYDSTGTLPTGGDTIERNQFYYVGNVLTNSFQLYYDSALTDLVTFTNDGTGPFFYELTELLGALSFQASRGTLDPMTISYTATVTVNNGDKLMPMIINTSSDDNIDLLTGFMSITKV